MIRNLFLSLTLLFVLAAAELSPTPALAVCGSGGGDCFWVPLTVSNAVSGTGGVCRLTVGPNSNGLAVSSPVVVVGLVGATECNGATTVSALPTTGTVELAGTTFSTAYVSGGTVSGGIWDGSRTSNWATTSGGTGGIGVPTSSTPVIADGNSGSLIDVGANVVASIFSLAGGTGQFAGTLDFTNNATGNYYITATEFAYSGTGTRTLNCGTATHLLTGSIGTMWDFTTTTGLTVTTPCNFNVTSTSPTGTRGIILGGESFGTISIAGASVASGTFPVPITVTASTVINTLNFTAPLSVYFTNNVSWTLTNAPIWTGTAALPIFVGSTSPAAGTELVTINCTCAIGSPALNYVTLNWIKFTGTEGTCTSCNDLGGNSGIIITSPSSGGNHIIGGGI